MQQRVLAGRYRLDDILGVGGVSTVWRARDEVLARDVAVKLLSGRYASDPAFRLRSRVEAQAAAALSHPNVAQVHDFGETVEDGVRTPYIVMELVPGLPLDQRLADAPVPVAEALRICGEVAAGLAAAHAAGLVHRDVKPANVILAPTGAKVVDFGIAATADSGDPDEELMGTPAYLAPERITGDAITPSSDVYSLGMLLYKLLAGRLPWSTSRPTDTLDAHLFAEPPPLPELDGVRPEVARLCLRCLAKDPAARPTAHDVAVFLAAHDVAASAATHEPPATPATTPPPRRRRLLLVVLGAAAAAGLLAWALIPASEQPVPAAAQPGPSLEPSTAPGGIAPAEPPSAPAAAAISARPVTTTGPAPTSAAASAGPATAATTTTATATATATATVEPVPGPPRTFTSAGGTVQARCTPSGQAELTSWSATSPYRVDWVNAGPAVAAVAAFTHGNRSIDMTVTCDGTTPTAATTSHGG
ncbi:serine/threonine-protein kinase [Dactylosporangium sp. CA-052675]|uniref:serine/threonine-protein kinase n=1 Tax=Dactylosporangium sp. CA-052675 TaxID=3239927 RepID=UPI003D8D38C4